MLRCSCLLYLYALLTLCLLVVLRVFAACVALLSVCDLVVLVCLRLALLSCGFVLCCWLIVVSYSCCLLVGVRIGWVAVTLAVGLDCGFLLVVIGC